MKKALSVLLCVAIIATLCSAMFFTAGASKPIPVKRLTLTATNLKLADDNMSEADAIAACTTRLGNELSTYAIYSKTADGKYNYLSCAVNTGWYKAGTATFDEIIALGGIYGVMFVGTFDDHCQPLDDFTEVKAAGADVTTFDFGEGNFPICTEDELAYVQNEFNERYEGVGDIACLQLYYEKQSGKVRLMEFQKLNANKDCIAFGYAGECKTFDHYLQLYAEYAVQSAKYVASYVISFDIIDGADQSIDLTKDDVAVFRSEGEFESFVGFMLDGKFVDEKYYTAKEGSTIVEVKKEYLNTLENGEHTVAIVSEEAIATTTFTLSGATGAAVDTNDTTEESNDNPPSGDNGTVAFAIVLMAVAFAAVLLSRREKAVR